MERSERSIDQYSRTMTTTLVKDAQRHLELQNLPINMPDPVPRHQFIKPSHGRTNMRGLTANETAEKQANQQRRQHQMSAQDQERRQQLLYQNVAEEVPESLPKVIQTSDLLVSQCSTSPTNLMNSPPSTPSNLTSLPIRTPPTQERPRPRKVPSPESVYDLPASTTPPKLNREKRKRVHTARYTEAKEQRLF